MPPRSAAFEASRNGWVIASRSCCRHAGRDGKEKLDLKTPFNFASTADTIGGNSGSPVLNRAGELVGVNFDRNRHGLVRNFVYTDVQARHISVHARAVLEALSRLYDADALVKELLGK
ncbi:MAG: S46 family peptidase [Gemmataceae bacterium]